MAGTGVEAGTGAGTGTGAGPGTGARARRDRWSAPGPRTSLPAPWYPLPHAPSFRHRPWSTVLLWIAAVAVGLAALMVAAIVVFVVNPSIVGDEMLDVAMVFYLLVPLVLPTLVGALLICIGVLVMVLRGRWECDRGRPTLLVVAAWTLALVVPPTVLIPLGEVVAPVLLWSVVAASVVVAVGAATGVTVRVKKRPIRH